MPFVRTQCAFPRDTGLAEDTQTNTWYWDADPSSFTTAADAASAVATLLAGFYNSIDDLMHSDIFNSPAIFKHYDMADPEPRIPVREDLIPMVYNGTGGSEPMEISMVVSFQAERESGVNQARRRGRVYLPTFREATILTANGRAAFSTAAVGQVANAASGLITEGVPGLNWAVYSPTIFAETQDLDLAFNDVVSGWVDREPDVQRRRGGGSFGRVVLPVPPP